MIEIRPARKGFVVFDTDEQEAIMRFSSYRDAVNLVAELVVADSCDQPQAWPPSSLKAQLRISSRPSGESRYDADETT